MQSCMDNAIMYGLLAVWYTSQTTNAQIHPASRNHVRSNQDLPTLQNYSKFLKQISETSAAIKHEKESCLIKGLKKFTERIQMDHIGQLPWSCDCRYFWRDLGDGYNPRFVRDGACHNSTCWFGHFECAPQKYALNVLRRSDALEDQLDYSAQLSNNYAFVAVNITVNCLCMRSSRNG
ncbi:protein trunk-like [Mercenaria mercenaria]|uniref:protein trunk-like n=1 Tax=Mercenaria mercenaria TaxID=6596 RepID=UPI00234F40E2|nr:protein trunk-like [Mercenaria mercenaria]